jgi:hypothetical protein
VATLATFQDRFTPDIVPSERIVGDEFLDPDAIRRFNKGDRPDHSFAVFCQKRARQGNVGTAVLLKGAVFIDELFAGFDAVRFVLNVQAEKYLTFPSVSFAFSIIVISRTHKPPRLPVLSKNGGGTMTRRHAEF